jgi:hypothetical protein
VNKIKSWFKGLSRVGKASAISAVALSSFVTAAAMTPPTQPAPASVPSIREHRVPVVTTKTETTTEIIPFKKQTIKDGSIAKGTATIKTRGVRGVKTITHTITLTDGNETNRKSVGAVTDAPITEVTVIGTYVAPVSPVSKCDSNYSGCVPIVSYDLDCPDIGYSVTVFGYDKHGFDRDGDGYGCESY